MLHKLIGFALILCLLSGRPGGPLLAAGFVDPRSIQAPAVLVLYDGPNQKGNPAVLDALYLANLLGHFTTRRTLHPLEQYQAGEWKNYDAVFSVVYKKHYKVPDVFLRDAADIRRPFCWLGNQVGQLDRAGVLRSHGLVFERLFVDAPLNKVTYKNRILEKGDPDTNILRVKDASKVTVIASATGPDHRVVPYIVRSGSFWVVADSPFSYISENDRYLAFADALHDILGIVHSEDHRALLRIEDINAFSSPDDLRAMLNIVRRHGIPFSFGFVPAYVNPSERIFVSLSEKPEVLKVLRQFVNYQGTPVLHGYTHQHRGVTTDDYEFYDDIADRPIRGDSPEFASRRLEEAIKDSMEMGLYPVTWETPHYAASALDYTIIRKYFDTTFERRQATDKLGSDQFFPYPIVDLYGQCVIPENLAYVPKGEPEIQPILDNASAAFVVRDGYASFFFHPFIAPGLLDGLIGGIEGRGYHFTDLKTFPNGVHSEGRVILTGSGPIHVVGKGRYFNSQILDSQGKPVSRKTEEVAPDTPVHRDVSLAAGQTFTGVLEDTRPSNFLEKLIRLAKGDASVLQRKWGHLFLGQKLEEPVSAVILWNPAALAQEAKDQQGFYTTLASMGFDMERVDVSHLTEEAMGPFTLLIVPQASARLLDEQNVNRIMRAMHEGITVITDGESLLSQSLGVTLGKPLGVENVAGSSLSSQEIHWADRPVVPWVLEPSGHEVRVYYSERDHGHPLAIGGSKGVGNYLYFSCLFSPLTGQGYERFPDFPSILLGEFNISPMLRRNAVDAYFDPGFRQSVSIERLARMWRMSGIRAVHVAAWHFYNKYSYDYARLIKVAHQNGILVYAWFEWPHVSQRFWENHPEWREKNALLADARAGWRSLMNFQDPDCMKAVLKDAEQFLLSADWDGVNIAELTFESTGGPQRPDELTPFNAQARRSFEKQFAFDPVELLNSSSDHYWKRSPQELDAFYRYRRRENLILMEKILNEIRRLKEARSRDWEIMITVLDSLQHPELHDYLGVDVEAVARLANRFDAVLQVEDPGSEWSKAPSRYVQLGERYRQIHLKRPFMIDINVLAVHSAHQQGFPTAQPTGVEFIELLRAASSQAPRICLYSESTIFDEDWKLAPYTMAADAHVAKEGDAWVIQNPYTVSLDLGRSSRKVTLDGQSWSLADSGEILIPPGEHRLRISRGQHNLLDKAQLNTRLLSISGELLGYESKSRGMEVEYRSPSRCALMFNKAPSKIYLDGKTVSLQVLRGDLGFVVLAPKGQHRLVAVTQSTFSYVMDFTSWIAASLLVLFGMISSGLLAALFLLIVLRRQLALLRRKLVRR